jgi:hypothetical protein
MRLRPVLIRTPDSKKPPISVGKPVGLDLVREHLRMALPYTVARKYPMRLFSTGPTFRVICINPPHLFVLLVPFPPSPYPPISQP